MRATTTAPGPGTAASVLEPPRLLRLRRFAVLRILIRPRATARLLGALAAEADMRRYAAGVVIKACAAWHVPRR